MSKLKMLIGQVRGASVPVITPSATKRSIFFVLTAAFLYHDKKHPQDTGTPEIEAFLAHLATERSVVVSTQNQAFNVLLFLYREILDIELGPIASVRAKKPSRLPTVLTRAECMKIIGAMTDPQKLMAQLLFGSGLRAMECLRLRVKDIDFEMNQVIVRDGKGS